MINRDLKCWEIIQCKRSEDCPARKEPHRPCWEIALELEDYRSAFHICKDCLVYLIKKESSVFSEEEMAEIIAAKKVCALEGQSVRYAGE